MNVSLAAVNVVRPAYSSSGSARWRVWMPVAAWIRSIVARRRGSEDSSGAIAAVISLWA